MNTKSHNHLFHLVFSVIMIFYNVIFGVFALINTLKARKLFLNGDYEGSTIKYSTARLVLLIGLMIGTLHWLIFIIALLAIF